MQKNKRRPSDVSSVKAKTLKKKKTWEERINDFVDVGIVVNYENMEGLLVNLGLIGALLLSLTVGVLAAVEVENVYYGDFRFAMISSSEFRHVVHHELVKVDFNFTVVFPKSGNEDDTIEDLHSYFLDDATTDHYGCDMLIGPWHNCNEHLRNMLLLADLTYEYFNMHTLYAYCTRHRCEWLLSRQFEFNYGFAAAFLLLAIMMSTMFYVVLMRSPIAEQVKKGNFDALKRFQFFAMPFMWLGYVALFLGSYFFFYSLVLLGRLRFPSWAATQELSLDTMYDILLPCMTACLIGTFLSNLASFYTIHDMLTLKWLPYASKSELNPDSLHPASVLRRRSVSSKSAKVAMSQVQVATKVVGVIAKYEVVNPSPSEMSEVKPHGHWKRGEGEEEEKEELEEQKEEEVLGLQEV